jgi:peptide/nickel transport system substrate-binding protein
MKPRNRDERLRDERVMEAYLDMQRGKINRRDFLRFASVMGASLTALGISACSSSEPTAQVVEKVVKETVVEQVEVTKVVTETEIVTATPEPTAVGGIKRGGKLNATLNYSTERFNDPAIISSFWVSNVLRQVSDYMVYVTPELTVEPGLATQWTPSEDGKVWTINLREGVKFNHGKAFNADDVVFTFGRLLDPETGSGFTSIANYLSPDSVEKVDDYTVKFHAERPVGDFPFHLFSYMAAVLPADWGGDFYEQPWGTGPYTIKEYRPDERIVFQRRDDHWRTGVDGNPLPYLDELEFRSYPDDASWLDALERGEIGLAGISVATMPQVMQMDHISPTFYQSGGFFNAVLHTNEPPFDDVRVREALKLAVDRTKWVESVSFGYAIPGNDTPLCPIYDMFPDDLEPTQQDIEKAKALLAEAGYPDGLDIKAHFINDHTVDTATWLAASAEAAGFRIELEPNPEYWQVWLDDWGPNKIGVSNWGMRATPSEYFNIAYHSGGSWNETHWNNAEFDQKLADYDASLDPAERKQLLSDLCWLIKNDGGLLTSGHYQPLYAKSVDLRNFVMNPIGYTHYFDCWLDT